MSEFLRFGFLLLPRFSLHTVSAALEALRVANVALGSRALDYVLLSADGAPVVSMSGEPLAVSGRLGADMQALHGFMVVAGALPTASDTVWIQGPLKAAATTQERLRGILGGLGCGAVWLAEAGFMDGYRCAVPGLHASSLSARLPHAIVSTQLYEIDRGRLSAVEGAATLDLMLAWLAQRYGDRVQAALIEHFAIERIRAPQDRRAVPPRVAGSAKLAEAVALMQANLGEPLSTEDIAGLVGVSRRQLERLFKQHLDTLPSRWYLEQRLERARRLLKETSQSILQVGLSAGFTSGAHFSNAYKQYFGHTPRDERSARAIAWRDGSRAPSGDTVDG